MNIFSDEAMKRKNLMKIAYSQYRMNFSAERVNTNNLGGGINLGERKVKQKSHQNFETRSLAKSSIL
jgi:hypothetical protein